MRYVPFWVFKASNVKASKFFPFNSSWQDAQESFLEQTYSSMGGDTKVKFCTRMDEDVALLRITSTLYRHSSLQPVQREGEEVLLLLLLSIVRYDSTPVN